MYYATHPKPLSPKPKAMQPGVLESPVLKQSQVLGKPSTGLQRTLARDARVVSCSGTKDCRQR